MHQVHRGAHEGAHEDALESHTLGQSGWEQSAEVLCAQVRQSSEDSQPTEVASSETG